MDAASNISIASHYRLANRLSGAEHWLLRRPAILMYLGFIGNSSFKSDYFRDAAHWQRVMREYIAGVVPEGWIGQTTAHERGGSVTMLIRSLPILQVSAEPQPSRIRGNGVEQTMDVASVAMISLTFIGAQVAQKAASASIDSLWQRFSTAFEGRPNSRSPRSLARSGGVFSR